MKTHRRSNVVNYDVSVQGLYDSFLSQPLRPSSSSPSSLKLFFKFNRKTFIRYATNDSCQQFMETGGFYYMELPSFNPFYLEVNRYQFHRAVFRAIEIERVEAEVIPHLADLIVDIVKKKLSEREILDRKFKAMELAVNVNKTHFDSPFDAPTDATSEMEESMEEYAEANNGKAPMSEKSEEAMLKNTEVTGEEDSGRQSEEKDCSDGWSRDQVKTKDCAICLDEIPVGSRATQVPCSHVFHSSCIEEWLRSVSYFCPTCLFEFPAQQES